MSELANETGAVCAIIDVIPEDGKTWAVVVSWKKGVVGLPDAQAWNEALDSNIAECKGKGATSIDSRVITASEDVAEVLVAARADLHRSSLIARGFKQREGRVEFRMPLDQALVVLESRKTTPKLLWSCVDVGSEAELARAAEIFRHASEGDPASYSDDGALGFLKNLAETEDIVQAPERIQIGSYEGAPAAILALMVYPSDGWSTVYYLGVLPTLRGRGFATEAMLHGFRCLTAMGGTTYHDGTGVNNKAARSLFAHLGKPPFREMEEWRLEL